MTVLRRLIAAVAATAMLVAGTTQVAHAAVIDTETAARAPMSMSEGGRERLVRALARDDVAALLAERGVAVKDAQARAASLTDAEAAQLAQQIDDAPAGGVNALGAVALVFVVLLITDILGFTKVFSFTRPIK